MAVIRHFKHESVAKTSTSTLLTGVLGATSSFSSSSADAGSSMSQSMDSYGSESSSFQMDNRRATVRVVAPPAPKQDNLLTTATQASHAGIMNMAQETGRVHNDKKVFDQLVKAVEETCGPATPTVYAQTVVPTQFASTSVLTPVGAAAQAAPITEQQTSSAYYVVEKTLPVQFDVPVKIDVPVIETVQVEAVPVQTVQPVQPVQPVQSVQVESVPIQFVQVETVDVPAPAAPAPVQQQFVLQVGPAPVVQLQTQAQTQYVMTAVPAAAAPAPVPAPVSAPAPVQQQQFVLQGPVMTAVAPTVVAQKPTACDLFRAFIENEKERREEEATARRTRLLQERVKNGPAFTNAMRDIEFLNRNSNLGVFFEKPEDVVNAGVERLLNGETGHFDPEVLAQVARYRQHIDMVKNQPMVQAQAPQQVVQQPAPQPQRWSRRARRTTNWLTEDSSSY